MCYYQMKRLENTAQEKFPGDERAIKAAIQGSHWFEKNSKTKEKEGMQPWHIGEKIKIRVETLLQLGLNHCTNGHRSDV